MQTKTMGRIRQEIEIDGRRCWTLFDFGARQSYIRQQAADDLELTELRQSRRAMLGGSSHEIRHACLIRAEVEGRPLEFQAAVIDEIGQDEDGREIDILFGALAMQLWGIGLDPQNERLDFSHYSRDFLEF